MSDHRPFIDPDEFIIVLDLPLGALSVDDLKRLRDAGIKTAWAWVNWYATEPRRGVYDWAITDYVVGHMAAAGMKLLMTVPNAGPTFAPDDWYLRTHDGKLWRAFYDGYREGWPYSELSPWNAEAMAYEREFQRMVIDRYASTGLVQCVCGGIHGAEAVLPGMTESWFDRHALESFRAYARAGFDGDLAYFNRANHTSYESWAEVRPGMFPTRAAMDRNPTTVDWLHDTLMAVLKERQAVFAAQPWRESWVMLPQRDTEFAEAYETGPRSCNWLAPELYRDLPAELGTALQIMLYEVFRPSGTQGALDHIRGYEGCTWVGSQFVQGLQRHTYGAIASGLRGFLCGPLHPESGYTKLLPEMLDVIRWSLSQWKAARQ